MVEEDALLEHPAEAEILSCCVFGYWCHKGPYFSLADMVRELSDVCFLQRLANKALVMLEETQESQVLYRLFRLFECLLSNKSLPSASIEAIYSALHRYANYAVGARFSLDLQKAVAGNPNTSPQILRELAEYCIEGAMYLGATCRFCAEPLLCNASLPYDAFVALAEYVASNKYLSDAQRALAKVDRTPPHVLAVLAELDSVEIRELVAAHSNTPPAALEKLSVNCYPEVRQAVASNPSAPPEILSKLASDSAPQVRATVAQNTSTPPDVLRRLFDRAMKYRGAKLRRQVLTALARNPSSPEDVLVALSFEEGDIGEAARSNIAHRG